MTIRRRDINPTLFDWIAVPGMHGGEPAGSGEDAGQMAALFGSAAANMQHDEHRGGKIVRQGSGEYLQRLNSTGGSADHDNVLFWHPVSVSHLSRRQARHASAAPRPGLRPSPVVPLLARTVSAGTVAARLSHHIMRGHDR